MFVSDDLWEWNVSCSGRRIWTVFMTTTTSGPNTTVTDYEFKVTYSILKQYINWWWYHMGYTKPHYWFELLLWQLSANWYVERIGVKIVKSWVKVVVGNGDSGGMWKEVATPHQYIKLSLCAIFATCRSSKIIKWRLVDKYKLTLASMYLLRY